MGKSNIKKSGGEHAKSLIDLFTEQMNQKRVFANSHTAANYGSCINKLRIYLGEQARSFQLQDVTPDWVRGWIEWLTHLHANHPETVDFYFRNARAMYNLAWSFPHNRRGAANVDPFQGIKIKMRQPSKRALLKDEVKELLSIPFRDRLNPIQHEAFDILRFIFFANGMVFQDVYNLRWDMVDETGHIRFLRSKTGGLIEVSAVPEALEIMERYRRPDSLFVFPFLHFGKRNPEKLISEQNALRRINMHASAIGKLAQLSLPLTTYVMRHTWATLMLESGKAVELISQCMGHSNIQTTQIYLSRISSTRVEAEINDMLKFVRQQPVSVDAEKTIKPKRKKTPYYNQKTERRLCMEEEIVAIESNNLLFDKTEVENEYGEKYFPFLIKKEKMPSLSF